ncbi:MAG: hypothetical protein ACOC43_13970 [Desulfohalobiaceae bacterium]
MNPKFRQRLLVYLNPILFLLAVFQISSGILMGRFFQLYSLHQTNGYLLGLVILLHIFLNWNWIKMNYLGKR